MPIVGFNFSKISAERKEPIKSDTKISNTVDITRVEEEKNGSLASAGGLVAFSFEYAVTYGSSARIQLEGSILFLGDSKDTKKTVEGWKKNKSLDPALSTIIFNAMLFKCNIKALDLEDSLNLPTHIRLPYVGAKPKE